MRCEALPAASRAFPHCMQVYLGGPSRRCWLLPYSALPRPRGRRGADGALELVTAAPPPSEAAGAKRSRPEGEKQSKDEKKKARTAAPSSERSPCHCNARCCPAALRRKRNTRRRSTGRRTRRRSTRSGRKLRGMAAGTVTAVTGAGRKRSCGWSSRPVRRDRRCRAPETTQHVADA